MADQYFIDLLKEGSEAWNTWRDTHPDIYPDLSTVDLTSFNFSKTNLKRANLRDSKLCYVNLSSAKLNQADLSGANLSGADLSRADLRNANCSRAHFRKANLSWANLSQTIFLEAILHEAILHNVDLTNAKLTGADLSAAKLGGADLSEADLSWADLSEAELENASFIAANLERANLTSCSIYGISVWDAILKDAIQRKLFLSSPNRPTIIVDNLHIAQFIYLSLTNKQISQIINTGKSRLVLIVGRFSSEHKSPLDLLMEELRQHNYSPVVFDFEEPNSQNLAETVNALVGLSRFVLFIDLSESTTSPQVLALLVSQNKVPVQPLLSKKVQKDEMFFYTHSEDFACMLPTLRYRDTSNLLALLKQQILNHAEKKAQELGEEMQIKEDKEDDE